MKILSDIEMRDEAETYLKEKLGNADADTKVDYAEYMAFLNEVIKRTPEVNSSCIGSWENEYIGKTIVGYKCPVCGRRVLKKTHYCPGCGTFLFC